VHKAVTDEQGSGSRRFETVVHAVRCVCTAHDLVQRATGFVRNPPPSVQAIAYLEGILVGEMPLPDSLSCGRVTTPVLQVTTSWLVDAGDAQINIGRG